MLLNIFLITLLVVLPTAVTVALLRMDRKAGRPLQTPYAMRTDDWEQAA